MKYFAHTDIVALKAFFLGLMVFDWQQLPADPVLLVASGAGRDADDRFPAVAS